MKLAKLRPYFKRIVVVGILIATVLLFVRYFQTHPDYVAKLKQTDPIVIIWIVLTNFCLIGALAIINHVSVQMCRTDLGKRESLLLTIYSSLANFFGPLQSGPGVRAAYLKTKYKILLRDFTFVTLIGYGIYAILSALFLVVGVLAWWQSVLVVLGAASLSIAVLWFVRNRGKDTGLLSRLTIAPRLLTILVLATVAQVTLTAVRYGIELHAVGADVSIGQCISYAGAANFALFVSITPDGIGVREAFLLFSQQLHGVSTDDIVAASLIDRASYVIFLALLGVIALALHAHKRFAVTKQPSRATNVRKP